MPTKEVLARRAKQWALEMREAAKEEKKKANAKNKSKGGNGKVKGKVKAVSRE